MSEVITPTETELKLALPGREAEAAVVACLRENGYTVEALDPVRNVDTYLDTFDWSLLKDRLSLRYRVSNSAAMYTLKSIGSIEDGIARRMETEVPLDGRVDAPTTIPVKPIRKLVDGIIFPRKLLEQVQVRTDRRRYRVISHLAGGSRGRALLRHVALFSEGLSPTPTGPGAGRAGGRTPHRSGDGSDSAILAPVEKIRLFPLEGIEV
jgi:hypothetical protein